MQWLSLGVINDSLATEKLVRRFYDEKLLKWLDGEIIR